jgi:hypothetical protein
MPLPPDESIRLFELHWAALRAQADQPAPRRRVVRDETQLAAALPYIEAAASRVYGDSLLNARLNPVAFNVSVAQLR